MSDHPNPFANLNLDKLLATPTPSAKPTPPAPEKQANKETRKQPSSPVELPSEPKKPTIPVPFTPDPLQKRPLTRKQTFELTENELEFMAQVKFELRELGITKNEMVITGLELLAKDYQANKKNSYLYRKFASRKSDKIEE
jgi:hypothetical protein